MTLLGKDCAAGCSGNAARAPIRPEYGFPEYGYAPPWDPMNPPFYMGGIGDRYAGCDMNATTGLLQYTPDLSSRHALHPDMYPVHLYGTIGDCYGGCGGGCLGHGCARNCTGTLLCYNLTVPALSFVRACLRALSKSKTFIACPSITSFSAFFFWTPLVFDVLTSL